MNINFFFPLSSVLCRFTLHTVTLLPFAHHSIRSVSFRFVFFSSSCSGVCNAICDEVIWRLWWEFTRYLTHEYIYSNCRHILYVWFVSFIVFSAFSNTIIHSVWLIDSNLWIFEDILISSLFFVRRITQSMELTQQNINNNNNNNNNISSNLFFRIFN